MSHQVLVLEDTQTWRKIFSRLLKDHGFNVSLAATYEDALKKFRKMRPDLVITDISLDRSNSQDRTGLKFLEAALGLGGATKYIVVTGSENLKKEQLDWLARYGAKVFDKSLYSEKRMLTQIDALLPVPAQHEQQGQKALVVEDDKIWQKIIRSALESLGFQVTIVNDLASALGMFIRDDFLIVTIDFELKSSIVKTNTDGEILIDRVLEKGLRPFIISGVLKADQILKIYDKYEKRVMIYDKDGFVSTNFVGHVEKELTRLQKRSFRDISDTLFYKAVQLLLKNRTRQASELAEEKYLIEMGKKLGWPCLTIVTDLRNEVEKSLEEFTLNAEKDAIKRGGIDPKAFPEPRGLTNLLIGAIQGIPDDEQRVKLILPLESELSVQALILQAKYVNKLNTIAETKRLQSILGLAEGAINNRRKEGIGALVKSIRSRWPP